jgi:hypothetical protein
VIVNYDTRAWGEETPRAKTQKFRATFAYEDEQQPTPSPLKNNAPDLF